MPEGDASGEDLAKKAQRWLEKYGNPDDVRSAREDWERFASGSTTATIFGAYDSGKSSLLRRLLVDADIPVPTWLTISARHETFEASDIGYCGAVLRDTPGLSPDSSDVRGGRNTATALDAIRATDVLIVVVTPQLLTGERELVSTVLDLPWTEGSLWFVISRFDEAGVDPEGDIDGYRRLSQDKTRELADELRRTLGRELSIRVFVASPDPYGIAGGEQQPDPAVWNPYRNWDGMEAIAAALTDLDGSVEVLRQAASTRYWLNEVRSQVTGMDAQEAEVQEVERTTRELKARTDQLSARLRELRTSARNDLSTVVGTVFDQAMTSSVPTEAGLKSRLTDALHLWLERQGSELSALVQDVELQLERQLGRPGWQRLSSLIEEFSVSLPTDAPHQDDDKVDFRDYKPRLLKLNNDLASTTSNLKKLVETKVKGSTRTAADAASGGKGVAKSGSGHESLSKVGQIFKGVDIATTVVPFALDALDLIKEYNRDAAQAEAAVQQRVQIEAQLEDLKREVAGETHAAFEAQCDVLATTLNERSASADAVISSLDKRRSFCDEAREDAARLLKPT